MEKLSGKFHIFPENFLKFPSYFSGKCPLFSIRIIIGSDRRPETKQRIEGKIVRFRSEGLGLGLGIKVADLNQIADLKISVLEPVKFRT